jgi:hypothetical protein
MRTPVDSFRDWLVKEINDVLGRKSAPPPLLVWCDPHREWLDLLRAASASTGFELWAPPDGEAAEHELLVRDRFHREERRGRVVWLPCARDEITWFKVFELQADRVWERPLAMALSDYGITIPRDHEPELRPLLAAHARQWFEQPRSAWSELTPGNARDALLDDQRMLEVLGGPEGEFDRLRREERFDFFARRARDDFGLPDPEGMAERAWRVEATARLLATEAASAHGQAPPGEGTRIIPPGLARDRALRLLRSWQNHVQFIPFFEALVPEADATLGLGYWARTLTSPPRSRASRAVEEALFCQMAEKLDRIEEVDALVRELERVLQEIKDREGGFWGSQARSRVGWQHLGRLGEATGLLAENAQVEKGWKRTDDAVAWYTGRGWQLDQAGEMLFLETPDMPASLSRVRARLRRGYLRATDRIGQAFSALLNEHPEDVLGLPTAGELALAELKMPKPPTALLFLDAFRYDLARRLADLLREGGGPDRARVEAAVAPIPSITPLGMAHALPLLRSELQVEVRSDGKGFRISARGTSFDLSEAEGRRQWLRARYRVNEFLTVADVLSGEQLPRGGPGRRLIVVHGAEFDREGHEGQLQLSGASEHLDRYAEAIRRLRAAGYSRIIAVTDHGFFHWQPDPDEREEEKPEGELLWMSRRAMVGRGLKHRSAVSMPVPGSELVAMVPRSVNAFRTYGGLGFFHGGATLQELIIPVLVASWPSRAAKVPVVLKPVGHIASEAPRLQVVPGAAPSDQLVSFGSQLARRVQIRIRERQGGRQVFWQPDALTVGPESGLVTVPLSLVEPQQALSFGTPLLVEVLDAETGEILDSEEVTLKVDIDEF